MADYAIWKQMVLEAAQAMARERYLVGAGGNVSTLVEGENAIAITPSGLDYLKMKEADICVIDFDKKPIEGERRPSIESGMHIAVYKARPDVNAVCHTHQVYPSMFAITNVSIPPLFDEQVANLGISVEVVPYGLSGSEDLLKNISAAVASQCNAYILQNHGSLLLGRSMEKAVTNVKLLDKVAEAYYLALSAGKPVNLLPDNASALLFALMKAEAKKEADRKKNPAA